MQKFLVTVSTVTAIALFAPLSEVEAQSNTKPVIAPPSRTINLTAEQSFIIKEIRASGKAAEFNRSGVELLGVVAAAGLERRKPAAEAGELPSP
jgi:hypothetical protein